MSSKRSTSLSKKSNSFNWFLLPLVLIIAIIPLLVRGSDYNINMAQFPWFPNNNEGYDFFLYYKSIWIITICSLALIPLGYKLIHEKKSIKFTLALIPLGLYALLAVLSSVFSEYSYFSVHGITEQFESVFVLLAYTIMTLYAFTFINTEEDVKHLFHYWIIGIVILCLLGISQFSGHDFFATVMGKKMITPQSSWSELDGLSFNFGAKRVYLTFYNPNYVGLYTALVTPIFFVMMLFEKNKKTLALYSFILISLLLCMFGSQSRNGLIALFISLLFILIIFRKILLKQWRVMLIALVALSITFVVVDRFNDHSFSSRLISMFNVKTAPKALTAIDTNEDNVIFTYQGEKLAVNLNVSEDNSVSVQFVDGVNGEVVQNTYDETTSGFTITDPRFPFTCKLYNLSENTEDTMLAFGLTIEAKEWIFTNYTEDGSYYYYNIYGKLDKIVPADSSVFTGYEDLAGRGFIWSRTIPLLKNNFLLGSGADTFAIAFPQQNYVDNYNYIGNQLLTKPHNLYLQMGVQTGVLSLIAFLLFYGIYLFSSLKLYIRDDFSTYLPQMGAAILVGTIGYMASCLVNDSTVSVSPVFWVLIGTGLAINHKVSAINKIKQ